MFVFNCTNGDHDVIPGASDPVDVQAVQMGPTSINVSWTPSTGATGYRINYVSSGGDNDSVTVSGGSTSSHTLTGLTNGLNYTISIVATSNTFPSANVTVGTVSLGVIILGLT